MHKGFMLFLVSLFFITSAWAVPHSTAIDQLEGKLEIRMATFLDGKAHRSKSDAIEYALQTKQGLVYSLIFTDHTPKGLQTGQLIRVRHATSRPMGKDGSNYLEVKAKDVEIVSNINAKSLTSVFGRQKTIVMMVNFQDQPNEKPWDKGAVKHELIDTINDMFYESSYHQTTLVGDVVGYYTVPINSNADCYDVKNGVPYYANQAASNAGIDLSLYTRRIYLFPNNPNCSWGGLGTLGGLPSTSWINGYNRADITAHELGHNFGLYHSHSLECDGSSNDGTCQAVEYGDFADTMGAPYWYSGAHFNAFQKERLGWLNDQASPPIQTITESGTYLVDAYETTNNRSKALKILKNRLPNGSENYYYLELRQNIGFDKNLGQCNDCDFTKGVIVHEGNLANADSSYILDMSPHDDDHSRMMSLQPGKTFTDTDTANGVMKVTVDSVSSAGATVTVKFGDTPPPVCVRRDIGMALSPSRIELQRGEEGSYKVTVKNNDLAGCPPSRFALSVGAPRKVNVTLSDQYIDVAPGAMREFFVKVKTDQQSPVGFHRLIIKAKNQAKEGRSRKRTAYLNIRAGAKADKTSMSCFRRTLGMSIKPSRVEVDKGERAQYTVTLRNNDTKDCSLAHYAISVAIDPNFKVTLPDDQITMPAGTNRDFLVTVATSQENKAGYYQLDINAASKDAGGHSRKRRAYLIVD